MAEEVSPVVVGVDGSRPSRAAVRWAADEAARLGRPLRLVHAVGPMMCEVPFYPAPMMIESIEEAGQDILRHALEEARARAPEVAVTTVMVADPPSVAMRHQAREAYEVVVGHRGRGGFAGLLLGSVGLHLVGHASGTVVVVRDGDRAERGEIAVGVDLSPHSEAALRYAFDSAAVRGARLRAVHAWCPPEGRYAGLEVSDLAEAAVRTVCERLAPWRERYPQVTVAENTVHGHPVETLVHASAEADLVVVAARGHSPLRLGSVSHGLVHHARCPVAVVQPGSDSGAERP